MPELDGVALVTGGGSGIGRQLCLAYARSGCKAIALADLNMKGLQETIKLIEDEVLNVKTLALEVNTTKTEDVQRMVSETVEAFGSLDYAANIAGVMASHRLPTSEFPHDDYDRVVNINTRAVFLCMQEEIKAMEKQTPRGTPGVTNAERAQRGAIVNIASVTGLAAIQNIMPYNVSKHAVIGLTKSAALDHGYQQIRVNCVCPGMADTPLVASRKSLQASGKAGTWATDGNVFQRLALPEEIADVCVFLSTCRASYVTGEAVTIDGGHMAALRYEPKMAAALASR